MKKFIVERNLPGAGNLTSEELETISQAVCDAIIQLGKPYQWVQSYVTNDRIYCVHIADSECDVREHAKLGNIPINTVNEVISIIDPLNSNTKSDIHKRKGPVIL